VGSQKAPVVSTTTRTPFRRHARSRGFRSALSS